MIQFIGVHLLLPVILVDFEMRIFVMSAPI